jgi:glucans biosynthesis protein C
MHLWFLEYLALTCAVMLVLAPLGRRICGQRAAAWFRAAVTSPLRGLVFAIPTLGTLAMMHDGLLDTPHSFVPELRIVLAYTVFFGFGWILYHHRDLLGELTHGVGVQLGAALLLGAANGWFLVRRIEHRGEQLAFWGLAVTGSLIVWLVIFGSTGFFVRHFSRPSNLMRYLSDSSYWQYLAHPPIVFATQLLVAPLPIAWFWKAAIVTAVSVPVLLLTYDWLVRSTWMGVLLNGRRYPRATTAFAAPAPVCPVPES